MLKIIKIKFTKFYTNLLHRIIFYFAQINEQITIKNYNL